jgi:hypothetical protein
MIHLSYLMETKGRTDIRTQVQLAAPNAWHLGHKNMDLKNIITCNLAINTKLFTSKILDS